MSQAIEHTSAGWSPLAPEIIEARTILTACLDGIPAARIMDLPLERIYQAGWHSSVLQGHYALACERLGQWCVEHGRYAHHVDTYDFNFVERQRSPPTNGDRERMALPPRRIGRLLRVSTDTAADIEAERQAGLYGHVPPWTRVAAELLPGDAVLVYAQLRVIARDDGSIDAHLCDPAGSPGKKATPELALKLSEDGKRQLLARIDPAAAPVRCRVLGLHRNHGTGFAIEVLQLELSFALRSW